MRARRCAGLLAALSLTVGGCGGDGGRQDDAAPAPASTRAAASPGRCDALCNRVRTELRSFTDWLEEHGEAGYVGEIGIPGGADAERWNRVAAGWYDAADDADLWVTAWVTGEHWGEGYPLATYGRSGPSGSSIDRLTSQAAVIEEHLGGERVLRGVNVAAGSSPAGSVEPEHPAGFSNQDLDVVPDRHILPESLRYLAARGISLVRLPFNWERLQPELGGPLAESEVEHLRAVIDEADELGMTVVLNMHNFGGYYERDGGRRVRRIIGTDQLPIDTFADSWARIASTFGDEDDVVWGLMNEPANMAAVDGRSPARVWEEASQAAVDAIRSTGDGHVISVAGYQYSTAARWSTTHPRPWIDDPLRRVRYEAHQYWDSSLKGEYVRSYDEELRVAERAGYRACSAERCPTRRRDVSS